MKAAIVILLPLVLYGSSFGQTTMSGKATTSGTCSPATTGNNNTYYFHYCGSDPEQGKKMEEILNKILLNQDMAAANAKLDEILRIVSTLGPPPARVVKKKDGEAAVEILKTAKPGASVSFTYIGSTDDPEISPYFGQIKNMFVAGGWQIVGMNTIGEQTIDVNGAISHGEGFSCIVNSGSEAGAIAKRAMEAAGLACGTGSATMGGFMRPGRGVPGQSGYAPPPPPPDVSISVGTRIMPQR
jgi:hypothetical protein